MRNTKMKYFEIKGIPEFHGKLQVSEDALEFVLKCIGAQYPNLNLSNLLVFEVLLFADEPIKSCSTNPPVLEDLSVFVETFIDGLPRNETSP